METVTTRTFRSGNSEAVRLPKGFGFGPDTEVVLVRSGDVLTVKPARKSVSEMIDALRDIPKPSRIETRDIDELPERGGL